MTPVEKFRNQIAASRRFLMQCTKPSKAEWKQLFQSTSVGMLAIGFTGYIIKAFAYPIFRKTGGMDDIIEE